MDSFKGITKGGWHPGGSKGNSSSGGSGGAGGSSSFKGIDQVVRLHLRLHLVLIYLLFHFVLF